MAFLRKHRTLTIVLGIILAYAVVKVLSIVPITAKGPLLNKYYMQLLMLAGINIIMTVSLGMVNGFTGQFSIGHAGFMAVGAYTSAMVTTVLVPIAGMSKWIGYPIYILAIILGGLLKLNQNKGGKKVPLLGDVPLVGGLFRSANTLDKQSKLYVFVKAEIIRPADRGNQRLEDLEKISERDRQAFEEHEQEFQDHETWPGIKPKPAPPARVLDAR